MWASLKPCGKSQFPYAAMFSLLLSFPYVLAPPTEDAWRDARQPKQGEMAKHTGEISLKGFLSPVRDQTL